MINGAEVIVHVNSNNEPFALELVANIDAVNHSQQGAPLNYILSFFSISKNRTGIDGRVVRSDCKNFRMMKHINGCQNSWIGFGVIPRGEEKYQEPRYYNNMACIWDPNYFLVLTRQYDKKDLLEKFYQSFESRDFAIWLSHGQFSISNKISLFLGIKSKLPESLISEMRVYDENLISWQNDNRIVTLSNKLKNASCLFNNLQVVNKKSNGDLIYWVSVYNTRIHNSGVYEQFELEAWANNQGPIVKGAPPLIRPVIPVQQNNPVLTTINANTTTNNTTTFNTTTFNINNPISTHEWETELHRIAEMGGEARNTFRTVWPARRR